MALRVRLISKMESMHGPLPRPKDLYASDLNDYSISNQSTESRSSFKMSEVHVFKKY